METNPYSAPDSNVSTQAETGNLHPPRRVPTGNGVQWISDGFKHFSQDIGNWILICIIGFAIMMALSFIPVVSQLAQFTAAIWTGGLMLGCRAQDQGEGLSINHLFAGFSTKPWPLLLISVITGVLGVAILVLVFIFVAGYYGMGSIFTNPDQFFMPGTWMPLLLGLLIFMALVLPIAALAWFAPALVVLNDVPVFEAMGMSFKACFMNFMPFLVYGLLLLLLFIAGSLPLFLGLLVVMPMFYGSLYRSYKDIFID